MRSSVPSTPTPALGGRKQERLLWSREPPSDGRPSPAHGPQQAAPRGHHVGSIQDGASGARGKDARGLSQFLNGCPESATAPTCAAV